MTEEEYFRKHYPDVCYNGKPLSPYWDFFQDGVEFGERQSEKKIEELEKENTELKAELTKKTDVNNSLVGQVARLEIENAELKEKREQDCDSSWHEGFNCSEKERLKQLTKATEIIKEYVDFPTNNDELWELHEKAKQFLRR